MRRSGRQFSFHRSAVTAVWLLAGTVAAAAEMHSHAPGPVPLSPAKPPGVFATQPESTRRMVELIQEVWRAGDPRKNPFRSDEQILIFEQMLATNLPLDPLLNLLPEYGNALLNSGRAEEALKQFEKIERLLRENNRPMGARVLPVLLLWQAVCHLRIGEQENCVVGHNADSCLLPIRGGGVHLLPRGSRGAIAVLERLLARYPGDLRARWLLNIAYMTLGEYPQKVPPQFLIDPKLFESEYDIKRFPDVAPQLGLDVDDMAGGAVMEDFDNDGFLDLLTSSWGFTATSPLHLFHNNGDGTFTERTKEAGLEGLVSGLNMIQGDYNNDGRMDVLVLRGGWLRSQGHHPNSLLRNNGDFTFTDVTVETGLKSFHPTQTAAWFDYNGDGWLDIFIGNESTENDPNACELFRNNGDGTFTECADENGVDLIGFVKGVTAGDYNNDGRPDLFISRRDGPKILLRNDGPAGGDKSPHALWTFTDVAAAAGITEPWSSFPCWFWDYNNDGNLDVMVTGYSMQDIGDMTSDLLGLPHAGHRARLYKNNGDGTFADVSKEAGVLKLLHTMGCNFGDLDNDGWLDFYVGTGDPDFATLIPNRMFRNDGHGNHWLKLKLEGTKSNRPAMGARIKVVAQTAFGEERAIYRTVGSGASFGASPVRRTEIGLGDVRAITRVEIFWPTTGVTQVLTGLALDQFYQVTEDATVVTRISLSSFALPTATDAFARPHVHSTSTSATNPGSPEWCEPVPNAAPKP